MGALKEKRRLYIGSFEADLYMPGCTSLKSKRMVLSRYKSRLRARYNVSISETGGYDKWQRAVIGIAVAGHTRDDILRTFERLSEFTGSFRDIEVLKEETEIL